MVDKSTLIRLELAIASGLSLRPPFTVYQKQGILSGWPELGRMAEYWILERWNDHAH